MKTENIEELEDSLPPFTRGSKELFHSENYVSTSIGGFDADTGAAGVEDPLELNFDQSILVEPYEGGKKILVKVRNPDGAPLKTTGLRDKRAEALSGVSSPDELELPDTRVIDFGRNTRVLVDNATNKLTVFGKMAATGLMLTDTGFDPEGVKRWGDRDAIAFPTGYLKQGADDSIEYYPPTVNFHKTEDTMVPIEKIIQGDNISLTMETDGILKISSEATASPVIDNSYYTLLTIKNDQTVSDFVGTSLGNTDSHPMKWVLLSDPRGNYDPLSETEVFNDKLSLKHTGEYNITLIIQLRGKSSWKNKPCQFSAGIRVEEAVDFLQQKVGTVAADTAGEFPAIRATFSSVHITNKENIEVFIHMQGDELTDLGGDDLDPYKCYLLFEPKDKYPRTGLMMLNGYRDTMTGFSFKGGSEVRVEGGAPYVDYYRTDIQDLV